MIELRRGTDSDMFGRLVWRAVGSSDGPKVLVSCDKGHIGSLADHAIAADGTVTPSLVCPDGGCDFHEHVRLVGWEA